MNINEPFLDAHNLPQPLSKEEMYRLVNEFNEGSMEARDKLITHNIRLVIYEVANKFKSVDYDKKDLVSIGNIGLLKAINTYDLKKGIEFATYATKCIDNEILMFLRKLKKDKNVDSLDRVIFQDKDGSELKLGDMVSDDNELVEDNEQLETYRILREIVKQLPERDKEIIMLYFGFYNGKKYTQKEIANKFNISQSYISRLTTKILKKIRRQMEEKAVIELHGQSNGARKDNDKMRKLKTIYEYFKDYKREQIEEMLGKLTEEEKKIITLRYGEDLDNPIQSKLSKEESYEFYGILVPKMKRLLLNLNNGQKRRGKNKGKETEQLIRNESEDSIKLAVAEEKISHGELKNDSINTCKSSLQTDLNKNITEAEISSIQEDKTAPVTNVKNTDITKDECIKILELLKTPTFSQMMSVLTVKESIIISLKLGYVDGKYFSTQSIAQFLEIDEDEVREITKKVLLVYKENINTFLDNIIEITTDQFSHGRVLSMKHNSEN